MVENQGSYRSDVFEVSMYSMLQQSNKAKDFLHDDILIPIYNLVLLCTAGTNGENQYGPDPLTNMPDFDFEQKETAV